MKIKGAWLIVIGLSMLSGLATRAADPAPVPYRFLKDIRIGGEGGWDYLSVDSPTRRLYVTHATQIEVVDLDADKLVGTIVDTPGVHGFALAPELGRGFASNGRTNQVSIVDLKTLKTIATVDAGENPDAIVYEPGCREVYAFNGRGKSATVIAAATGKVVATVPLPGKPEFAAADPQAARVYCNIEDRGVVVAIDTKTHKIASTWPIMPGEEASGMAFDVQRHRLFIGCHNRRMVMMDSATGQVLTSVTIGERVDANAFDPANGFVFASNGDGTVTVAHEETPDKLTVIQTLATAAGSRTMALDPQTHKIYLAAAQFESATSTASATRQRPKVVPGSFKILVYGM